MHPPGRHVTATHLAKACFRPQASSATPSTPAALSPSSSSSSNGSQMLKGGRESTWGIRCRSRAPKGCMRPPPFPGCPLSTPLSSLCKCPPASPCPPPLPPVAMRPPPWAWDTGGMDRGIAPKTAERGWACHLGSGLSQIQNPYMCHEPSPSRPPPFPSAVPGLPSSSFFAAVDGAAGDELPSSLASPPPRFPPTGRRVSGSCWVRVTFGMTFRISVGLQAYKGSMEE